MLLESILSCSYLLLACGTSIYRLLKESSRHYNEVLPHFTIACLGIASIGARSFFALAYKLFFKRYAFDPVIIELEEKRDKSRVNAFDLILAEFSMASIIYSLFCHHGYRVIGLPVIAGTSGFSLYQLWLFIASQSQERDPADLNDSLHWVFFSGYFAYHVSNNYGLVANYPYLVTSWALPPEGFYQGWTVKRTINDYMMTAYVLLMTEALRPASQ